MSNISQWSVLDASNSSNPPAGAPENIAPSTVNDIMRAMMGATARWYSDTDGSLVTAGAGNSYTLTTNSSFTALADISLLVFRVDRANTDSATLAVDGLPAKTMRSSGSALISGQLVADTIVAASYNSTDDVYDLHTVPKIDAEDLVGEIADARLSANVPLKNASNIFLESQLVSRSDARVVINDSAATSGTQPYILRSSSGDFFIHAGTVDGTTSLSGATQIFRYNRGTGELSLDATSITANGSEVLTAAEVAAATAIDVSGLAATDGIYVDDGGVAKRLAFQDMGVRVENSGTQTFALADANTLQFASTTDSTYTIPPNSSVAFPVGTVIYVASAGTATMTIDPGSGVTLNSVIANGSTASRTVLAGGMAALVQVLTDEWQLSGDIS